MMAHEMHNAWTNHVDGIDDIFQDQDSSRLVISIMIDSLVLFSLRDGIYALCELLRNHLKRKGFRALREIDEAG